MLMPVPGSISQHPDFGQVFSADADGGGQYCAVVANQEHRRQIQIIGQDDRVYLISAWDQIRPTISDAESGAVALKSPKKKGKKSEGGLAAVGEEQEEEEEENDTPAPPAVTGMPKQLDIDKATAALVADKQDYLGAPCVMPPDGTHECGVVFDSEKWVDYKSQSDALGFVSRFLEPMLEDATTASELDESPRVWVSANTLKAVETQRAALKAAKPTVQGSWLGSILLRLPVASGCS